MQSLHPDFDTAAAKARHTDIRREAEHWRRTRAPRQSWFSRQGCWLLCRLGQALVWMGGHLESWGAVRLARAPTASGHL